MTYIIKNNKIIFINIGIIQMERYNSVRRRLDQLNYNQQLDQKSVQLVEKLVNDLLRTTEGF